MGFLGIIISLILLMYLAYRGMSVIIIAPLLALLATFLQGGQPLMGTFTQIFMVNLGSFAVNYFPIFLLGAIFGKVLEVSGSASSIARALINSFGKKFTIPAIVISCGLLTYGGVSAFVVAFSVFPLAAAAFQQAELPKQLIPGCIALGAFTFSMTCLPGTIQIHNLIPMTYFGTDAYAAPVLGIIAGLMMLGLGLLWLQKRSHKMILNNQIKKIDTIVKYKEPHWSLAVTPIALVIILNLILAKNIIPKWDLSYLQESKFTPADPKGLVGMWSMIIALFIANVFTIILHWKNFKNISEDLKDGAMSSLLPTFNTASEVGYGATIKSLAAFAIIKGWMVNISPNNPLITEVASINVLAGITGSAAGGLSIALAALGETFSNLANQAGISPEIMHRLASMASGGLDTLPHNGAVITLLTICGLSHKESYKDIAMVSLVIPLIVTSASVIVVSFF